MGEILALKWQLKTRAMANFENIYAMLKYRGKGSQTVFKCHGSLETAPSSSAVFLIPPNHWRGQNITLQSPVRITNFHSNSLHSSLATLKCFGQSSSNFLFKEKATVKVYHNHSGVRSLFLVSRRNNNPWFKFNHSNNTSHFRNSQVFLMIHVHIGILH